MEDKETKEDKIQEEPSKFIPNEMPTEEGFNPMKLLENPLVNSLMESGKELFKKEKPDPNVCEITIKAPSEVVLKLFRVS